MAKNKNIFYSLTIVRHDFDDEHEGKGCNKEGLMSYVDSKDEELPNAWSTCSNSDFENWYRAKGHKCLKSGAGGSGGSEGSGGPGGSGGILKEVF